MSMKDERTIFRLGWIIPQHRRPQVSVLEIQRVTI
jgi:hypothetical protein